jgi:hypothetical protein
VTRSVPKPCRTCLGRRGCIACAYSGGVPSLLYAEKVWLATHAPDLGSHPPENMRTPPEGVVTGEIR